MKILVTGGAGFIGSHLTEQLLEKGHEVIAIDNFSTGRRSNLPSHPRLKCIEADVAHLKEKNDFSGLDAIAHLAAEASVQKSWESPRICHDANLTGTMEMLSLCAELKVPKFVFASSAATYGLQESFPICETASMIPSSPYGLQKLVGEQYGRLFARHHGFSFVGLRFFNVYGPRQDPNSPYSGVISLFMDAMTKNEPITIFGDGKQVRDFVFVKDVVRAIEKALMISLSDGDSTVCNLGSAQETSLLDLVEVMQQLLPGWERQIHFKEPRPGDIKRSLADVSQAKKILGWEVEWDLKRGLTAYVQSKQDNNNT